MTRTTSRRAVTLTEVLIAIFLMGIGLMAILSLFPLGASQMAQALQDQRAAEAATTAAAFARTTWKQACDSDLNDARMKFLNVDGSVPVAQQPFIMAMDDPNSNVPTSIQQALPTVLPVYPVAAAAKSLPPAPSTGPSYPVLVDPIGWQAQANAANTTLQWWVAGLLPGAGVPRRTLMVQPSAGPWVRLSDLGTLPVLKQFSLMDDMTFDLNGTPKGSSASPNTPVERQGRFSWAFLFRRSNNADRTAVDITTILYSGRSIDVASPETAYAGVGAVGSKSLTLSYSAAKPALRRGGWVLDATMGNDDSGKPTPQGIFYRVVNVDDSTPGQVVLELQTQLLGGPSNSPRTIVVMEKVIDVFTKKDVTNVAPAMPY